MLVLAFAGMAMVACGGSDDAAVDHAADTASPDTKAEVYLAAVHESGRFTAVDDAAMLTAGQAVCGALDRGATPLAVLSEAAAQGDDQIRIVGLAVSTLCREHQQAIEMEAAALSG